MNKGREFHNLGAATIKERSPHDFNRQGGQSRGVGSVVERSEREQVAERNLINSEIYGGDK